jgi:hypothetical protein
MRTGLSSALIVGAMLAGSIGSPRAADYPRNEVWFGAGGATGFENSVYNLPNDVASNPEIALSLGFMRNLSARSAIGVYFYDTDETTSGANGSPFTLANENLGVRYRHTFARRSFVPYLFAGASVVVADLSSSSSDGIGATGFSVCLGPGVGLRLGTHLLVSAEGMGSYGVAEWEKPPAAGSTDQDFNPSLLSGMIHIGYAWGGSKPPAKPATEAPTVPDSGLVTGVGADSSQARQGPSVATVLVLEGLIMLNSSAAYAGDKGGLLAGITAATALLGAAAGGSRRPSFKIAFYGLLSLAAVELTLGQVGVSEDGLFATSMVGWNVIALAAHHAEEKARARQ